MQTIDRLFRKFFGKKEQFNIIDWELIPPLELDFLESLFQQWPNLTPGEIIKKSVVLFERYKLEKIIGLGGTSIVLSASDTKLDRRVALKIWNPRLSMLASMSEHSGAWVSESEYTEAVEYFRREAKRLASISHANICTVFDFGVTEKGIPWLTMELIQGSNLRDALNQWIAGTGTSNNYNLPFILGTFRQIVSATSYLHQNGIYQLDLKPENIMINSQSIKLIDMASGLEKAARGKGNSGMQARCGSPGYLAPELLTELEIGPAADVFSLGMILLEMCCLHNPLASAALRQDLYEAIGVTAYEFYLDFTTAVFDFSAFEERSNRINETSERYSLAIRDCNVHSLLQQAPVPISTPIANLIAILKSE